MASPHQQPRRTARELTLLSLSQLKNNPAKLEQEEVNSLLLAAIRTITTEAQSMLETASAEVNRSNERLLSSEIRSTSLESAKAMLQESVVFTQKAINWVAIALEFPETLQLANQHQVREYAIALIGAVHRRRQEIDEKLEAAMVDWQLKRLPRIDQDIFTHCPGRNSVFRSSPKSGHQ